MMVMQRLVKLPNSLLVVEVLVPGYMSRLLNNCCDAIGHPRKWTGKQIMSFLSCHGRIEVGIFLQEIFIFSSSGQAER